MSDEFQELLAEVMSHADHFGHREHLELTWLAVRRHGSSAAVELVSEGIQRTARYERVPRKYHATISRAWVELVGHHVRERAQENDFAEFVARNPALLDKRLINRFYHASTLASSHARSEWVEPDRTPFP
ncbi:hypothetical protein [Nocardia iowensis]|uniref:Uncharacterized protein n=1 Tax=Nocardia iowensis TaxID=204891 RepID=A0ABX8RYG7_NOCIO|nr:hypothetical protein [Nocardia iowensis]QXN94331.1 hypothetical protein KV110_15500 [Nocardia iowensis]